MAQRGSDREGTAGDAHEEESLYRGLFGGLIDRGLGTGDGQRHGEHSAGFHGQRFLCGRLTDQRVGR